MPSISKDDYRYYEMKAYLPMLITILERDLVTIAKLPIKLKRPYITIMESALKRIRADLKATNVYLLRRNMRLVIEKSTKESTTYVFISTGYEERHTFTSEELRNKCEELMTEFLTK
ncbi:hypothetical protein [Psychrobacillus sp. FSL K6-1415]|uniref:hypothetical protein n=1 Tax=Psychrobacillus sp. FSL K6-1415 TaxID=2921544 RepID=UPI0030F9C6C4